MNSKKILTPSKTPYVVVAHVAPKISFASVSSTISRKSFPTGTKHHIIKFTNKSFQIIKYVMVVLKGFTKTDS